VSGAEEKPKEVMVGPSAEELTEEERPKPEEVPAPVVDPPKTDTTNSESAPKQYDMTPPPATEKVYTAEEVAGTVDPGTPDLVGAARPYLDEVVPNTAGTASESVSDAPFPDDLPQRGDGGPNWIRPITEGHGYEAPPSVEPGSSEEHLRASESAANTAEIMAGFERGGFQGEQLPPSDELPQQGFERGGLESDQPGSLGDNTTQATEFVSPEGRDDTHLGPADDYRDGGDVPQQFNLGGPKLDLDEEDLKRARGEEIPEAGGE
jgi:hypothetical protein